MTDSYQLIVGPCIHQIETNKQKIEEAEGIHNHITFYITKTNLNKFPVMRNINKLQNKANTLKQIM